MVRTAAVLLAASILTGCACTDCDCGASASAGAMANTGPKPVAAARASDKAAFEQLKKLEGTWQMKDESGNAIDAAVFEVSSNGSVVREIMFPGSEHEMTNLYHFDGPSLVMTHYCAVGNQPRMRSKDATPQRMAFAFDSVTNMTAPDQHVMASMTLVVKDDDTIIEEWRSMVNGKEAEHNPNFELTRKK
jgi:hypothetical protein